MWTARTSGWDAASLDRLTLQLEQLLGELDAERARLRQAQSEIKLILAGLFSRLQDELADTCRWLDA